MAFSHDLAQSSDSTSRHVTATQQLTKEQVESLLQATLQQSTIQQSEASTQQTLHLLIYDTTAPTDTLGRHPIKAELTKTTDSKRTASVESEHHGSIMDETATERSDSTSTNVQSMVHAKQASHDAVEGCAEAEETKQTKRGNAWESIEVMAALTAICAIVIIKKRKH